MKIKQALIVFFLLFLKNVVAFADVHSVPGALNNSQQLLLVVTPAWDSMQGQLLRYHRSALNKPWVMESTYSIPVVVGKKGLAWGEEWALKDKFLAPDRMKKEGDGRSPVGVYPIGTAFGFSKDTQPIPSMTWKYFPLTKTSICVDDPASIYYNQLINSASVPHWNSHTSGEDMVTVVPQYTWGSVIDYNPSQVKGAGSCIFMHVWRDNTSGTAGCVAMEQDNMMTVLGWLDSRQSPVIALLPREVYQSVKGVWGLP